jgi:predicted nucleotidyltransferase
MTTSISDALFTKTQQRVLGLLYGKPDRSFYLTEIIRSADMGRGTIRRELDRLVEAGLVTMRRAGNQHHYQANAANPVFTELAGIVRKTFGVVDVIRTALGPVLDGVELAFIYGSVAKGEATAKSDVDLIIVADDLAYAEVMALLAEAEQSLGREINPNIYDEAQFKDKLKAGNTFLTRVMAQEKLWIKGEDKDEYLATG